MRMVVSDTSPISCLASLDRLDILHSQFGSVNIPPSVSLELSRHPKPGVRSKINKLVEKETLCINSNLDLRLQSFLNVVLDSGEADAISLACQMQANLLLIDERSGRQQARQLGLRVTGTLGVLMKAKLNGELDSLAQSINVLKCEYGFSIAPELIRHALQEVGEYPT